jgi:hypothetical protein
LGKWFFGVAFPAVKACPTYGRDFAVTPALPLVGLNPYHPGHGAIFGVESSKLKEAVLKFSDLVLDFYYFQGYSRAIPLNRAHFQ